jgi:hypothetical protein
MTEHGPPGPPFWIPAFAGMTEESAGTRPCRGSGCPRVFSFFPQELGVKGVEETLLVQLFCHRRHAQDEEL